MESPLGKKNAFIPIVLSKERVTLPGTPAKLTDGFFLIYFLYSDKHYHLPFHLLDGFLNDVQFCMFLDNASYCLYHHATMVSLVLTATTYETANLEGDLAGSPLFYRFTDLNILRRRGSILPAGNICGGITTGFWLWFCLLLHGGVSKHLPTCPRQLQTSPPTFTSSVLGCSGAYHIWTFYLATGREGAGKRIDFAHHFWRTYRFANICCHVSLYDVIFYSDGTLDPSSIHHLSETQFIPGLTMVYIYNIPDDDETGFLKMKQFTWF